MVKLKIHNREATLGDRSYKLNNNLLFHNFDTDDIDIKLTLKGLNNKGNETINNFIKAMTKIGAITDDNN